ncbi:tail fiber protein [uncultured Desulfovibrio sp.]|uniref:tail fiber protein n=1 Tax=uncultured Desulfovibrio sp. TaxID=167968 RepID=UPI00261F6E71|nr:tail fiber protein [uncultured Desulfovibrio sp.]
MTMPSSVSRARFEGNGTATEFPFAFKVWDVSQLTVTLTDPDGKSSPATGWTAQLAEDGGTVAYLHEGQPLPVGWLLAITRNMPFTQEIDLVSATRFDPAVMEDGLDMATAERQQLREQLSRSVILPATSDQSPQELADRLLEAEKTAVSAAQKAGMDAAAASEQADRAESQADKAAIQAAEADDAARLARAWAESPTPPDPDEPDSKSAREWALVAADTVPLATASLPGKASFPPPFTVDAQGAVGVRYADTGQNGLVRLTDAVNSATSQLAASDTAVKTAYDKAVATAGLWIGVPRFWRGTTLPPDHCWANGDFVAFADWPELKAVYEAGGFAGMLMAWNADKDTKAANLGQWRPDDAEPTGLFTPNLTGQFLRCWGPGIERQAGSWQADAFQGHGHILYAGVDSGSSGGGGYMNFWQRNHDKAIKEPISLDGYGTARIADETRPANIALPCIIYLGQPAQPEELA